MRASVSCWPLRLICAAQSMTFVLKRKRFAAISEYVTKVHAVCTVCGSPATRSQRVADSDEQVLVGGEAAYEARCRKHWSPQPVFSAKGNMDELED